MNYIELESERLLFRKYCLEDYSVFYDMLSNLENMKYRSSEPKNEKDVTIKHYTIVDVILKRYYYG